MNTIPQINKITLDIHSFIDIITNSSTEIFVQATSHTIKNVKELVNSLLKLGGSQLTADDLFTFELEGDDDEPVDIEDEDDEDYYDSDSYPRVSLIVKASVDADEAKTAAKIMSGLTGLFNIEAAYQ